MANYRKSFNLRNGVQVDDDNFIVNANGLVGIGTSVPAEILDVVGNVKVSGLTTTRSLYAGIGTIDNLRSPSVIVSGVVTATAFSGSASQLTGIYAIAVDGWYINSGTISTTSKVGIGTTLPVGDFQVGSGVTINRTGNASYSGIVTALRFDGPLQSTVNSTTGVSTFADLNVINSLKVGTAITMNSGIVTATTFVGNLTGTATQANSITPTSNITVNSITVNSINSGLTTSGISTVYNQLNIFGNVGVGTTSPNSQIHIRKSGISSIQLTSDGSNSSVITFGRSNTTNSNNAQLRFGNTSISFPDSTQQSLDIINYDTGNLNFYLNPGGSGTGVFNWFDASLTKRMTLTSSGNLGINYSSPSSKLYVNGDIYVTGVATVGVLTSTSLSSDYVSAPRLNTGDIVGTSGTITTFETTNLSAATANISGSLSVASKLIAQTIQQTNILSVNTGISSIEVTPTSVSSTILILACQNVSISDGISTISLEKDDDIIGLTTLYSATIGLEVPVGGIGVTVHQLSTIPYLDSPGTLGIVTYRITSPGLALTNGQIMTVEIL